MRTVRLQLLETVGEEEQSEHENNRVEKQCVYEHFNGLLPGRSKLHVQVTHDRHNALIIVLKSKVALAPARQCRLTAIILRPSVVRRARSRFVECFR